MTISVKIPGSCGELVQGTIDDTPFLVTCPINRFANAKISIDSSALQTPLKSKCIQALTAICTKTGLIEKNINIELFSDLIEGKGMSSSSADIAAVCYVVSKAYNIKISAAEIADIAATIEPTDGVFCPGIVKFNHITGQILKNLGEPPLVQIVIFDCGGNVDTVLFNKRSELPLLNKQKEQCIKKSLKLVEYGIKNNDIDALGEGCTISALANQTILYKNQLPQILILAKSYGAVGINIAHSGTIIGTIFPIDSKPTVLAAYITEVQRKCNDIKFLSVVKLISGGCY